MNAVILIGGPLLLGFVLWVLLDRHEKRRAARGLPRHSGLRLAIAAAGLLLLLFAGGCSLIFEMSLSRSGVNYIDGLTIFMLGGPPFALGLLAFWLAMRRKSG